MMNETEVGAESERVRVLSDAFDPGSLRWLSPRVRLGDHCLVLGAGTQPIARWFEQAVGPDGRVTAIDTHPRLWCQVSSESPQIASAVLQGLRRAQRLFDLLHVRFALVHALNPDEMVAALVEAVKPGGWLILEEPDFGGARVLAGPEPLRRSFNNVQSAIELVFATLGLDHAVGARIPALLQQHSFTDIAIEHDAAIVPGGSPVADVMAMSATEVATAYVATGFASLNDIERYRHFAGNRGCWGTYLAIIRGAGQRPME